MMRAPVLLPRMPAPPSGKPNAADQHLDRSGHHQGDDREIEPAHPQRRQADDQAERRRGNAAGQQRELEGNAEAMGDAQREPAADPEQAKLGQRHHAELGEQQADAETADRQRRRGDEGPQPIVRQNVGQDSRAPRARRAPPPSTSAARVLVSTSGEYARVWSVTSLSPVNKREPALHPQQRDDREQERHSRAERPDDRNRRQQRFADPDRDTSGNGRRKR